MKIDRPGENEYAPFYAGYVARVPETDVLAALRAQPDELGRVASSVSKDKERFRYGEEKWSVREIFGHLVDSERFFGHRAFCVSRGDATPLPGFDEKLYVSGAGHDSRPLADLVKDFSLLREANVRLLENLVRDRLLYTDTCDPLDHVLQAFEMLDVQSGPDIDPVAQCLLDVLMALHMDQAGSIAVRQLIDE